MQPLGEPTERSGGTLVGNRNNSKELRLLAIDGGGVRGLSALQIIKQLMESIDPTNPPKPCDCFDMIGGTSTGGLIAVMLGRLEMTVDEAIDAYKDLSPKIFVHIHHRITWRGQVQGRFDHEALENGVKAILDDKGLPKETLLHNPSPTACKTFVCATSKQTKQTVVLSSYLSRRRGADMLRKTKIWEAARATSAASSFFDSITIGDEDFIDGATAANNPISEMWTEAYDTFQNNTEWSLEDNICCLVSVGTGMPSIIPFGDDPVRIGKALLDIATDTESKAEDFHRHHTQMANQGRYFRFNVTKGLEAVGLEDASQVKTIVAVTRMYIQSQKAFEKLQTCAKKLDKRQILTLAVELAQRCGTQGNSYSESCLRLEESTAARRSRSTSLTWFKNTSGYRQWLDWAGSILWYPLTPRSVSLQHENLATCVAYDLLQEAQLSNHTIKVVYFTCSADMDSETRNIAMARDLAAVDHVEISLMLQSILAQLVIACGDMLERPSLHSLDKASLRQVFLDRKCLDVSKFKTLLPQLLAFLPMNQKLVIILDKIHCVESSAMVSFVEEIVPRLSSWPIVRVLVTSFPNGTIGDNLRGFVKVDEDTECSECLDSLKSQIDIFARRDQIHPPEEGTNEWIWTNPVYQDWEKAHSGILWIQGKAGSGKSVLAKSICTRLSQRSKTHQQFVTRSTVLTSEFFYNRRGGSQGVSHESMLRSILYQVLEKDRTLFKYFQDEYRSRRWRVDLPNLLTDILLRIANAENYDSQIISVIDALDESRQRDDEFESSGMFMEAVIKIFKSIVEGPRSRVKLVVLSRPNKSIEQAFKSCYRILLENENTNDISAIVDARLQCLQRSVHSADTSEDETEPQSIYSGLTRQRAQEMPSRSRAKKRGQDRLFKQMRETEAEELRMIGAYLKKHASGVILWVTLIVEELAQRMAEGLFTYEELHALLLTLPLRLTGMYSRMVDNLIRSHTADDLAKAKHILVWIMGASETKLLSLEELWDALAIPSDIQSALLSEKDPIVKNHIPFHTWNGLRRSLHKRCGSFIEIIAPSSYLFGPVEDPLDTKPHFVVQFIHQTAKDYLQSPDAKFFRINLLEAVGRVREEKMRYLKLSLPLMPTNFVPSLKTIQWQSVRNLTFRNRSTSGEQSLQDQIAEMEEMESWINIVNDTASYMDKKILLHYVLTTSPLNDDYKSHFGKLGVRYASRRQQLSDKYNRPRTNKHDAPSPTYDCWLCDFLRKQEYTSVDIINSAEYTVAGRYFGFACRSDMPNAVQNMLDIVSSTDGWWKHNRNAVISSALLEAITAENLVAVKALTEGTWISRDISTFEPFIRRAVRTGNRPIIFHLHEIATGLGEEGTDNATGQPRARDGPPKRFDFNFWGLSTEPLPVDHESANIQMETSKQADSVGDEIGEAFKKIVDYIKSQEALIPVDSLLRSTSEPYGHPPIHIDRSPLALSQSTASTSRTPMSTLEKHGR